MELKMKMKNGIRRWTNTKKKIYMKNVQISLNSFTHEWNETRRWVAGQALGIGEMI